MNRFVYSTILLTTTLLIAQTEPEIKKESYHFDVSGVTKIDVTVDYGLGELTIRPNDADESIDGIIEYDSRYVTPEVSYRATGSRGDLDIDIETPKMRHGEDDWSFHWKEKNHGDFRSSVEFRLPLAKALDTRMDFGLGDADIDLSGLHISNLELECGLSDVRVTVDAVSPGRCESISIESGLGDFNAGKLGNLKAEELHLEVGLGSAVVDLTGDFTTDLEADIGVGLGSLDLLLPKNANIRIEVESTFLSSVNVRDLVKDGDEWVSRRWDDELPTLELQIGVGLGSVDVEIER